MPVSNKEKCICQICICGQHRCEASKSGHFIENLSKSKEKTSTEREINTNKTKKAVESEKSSSEKRDGSLERSRRQWETSPDQMKEISRSLSELNGGTHQEKKDQTSKIRTKRSKSKENIIDSQTNRSTLPPINTYSDSDSGKELTDTCICETMYKSNGDLYDNTGGNQWVVSRPIRNRPKDNLQIGNGGPMDMDTTFKTSYDSTAKQINENYSKSVAVVMPSNKLSSDETNFERLKASKSNNELNSIKSSKKKVKHRPSTSLKAGGDGYFNTINKESYKNFVIIDGKCKTGNGINSSNGNKASVCCSTVSNIKLPKVDSNNREDNQHISRRLSREDKSQIESINKSMQTLTTSDRNEPKVSETTQTNGNFFSYVDPSVQTNYDYNQTNRKQKHNENTLLISQQKEDTGHQRMADDSHEANTSWTIDSLEGHKRIYTRDVDSIQELGLMNTTNQRNRETQQISEGQQTQQSKPSNGLRTESTDRSREKTRVRYESKNYVQQQTRQKKHKNESSMRLFDGDMDFTTTTRTYFADKSPNRADPNVKPIPRERTAGKKSRKSGKKRNLFRTSTEAEFYEPYGETKTTQTTYQKQFGDRLYCPVIDLGSNRSDFKYRGEASGHKFFLPAVNN